MFRYVCILFFFIDEPETQDVDRANGNSDVVEDILFVTNEATFRMHQLDQRRIEISDAYLSKLIKFIRKEVGRTVGKSSENNTVHFQFYSHK